MTEIVSYSKKGQTYYKFQAYLGMNQITGKRKSVSRSGFKTKREARIVLDRLKYEFEHSMAHTNDEITFDDVYKLWLPVYATTVTESTLSRVKGIFEHHATEYFGHRKIADINVVYCQGFVTKLSETIKDIRKVGNYVGMVFKYAMKMDFIQKNPMAFVTYPQNVRQQNNNFWSREQLRVFLDELDQHCTNSAKMYTFLRLMAVTGARKGELLALQINDYDSNIGAIQINKTLTLTVDHKYTVGKTKTTNGNRTLYLDKKTVRILNQWLLAERQEMFILGFNINDNPNQLLFPSTKNTLLSPMKPNKWLSNIIDRYNKNHTHKNDVRLKSITPHGLRHTLATLLSESGATLKQVQLQLGDSDLDTVLNTYTHLDEQMKKDTAKQFADFVGL